jgi:hypothetical protein
MRTWLPILADALGPLLAALLLMGYEVYLHERDVPPTWITVIAVGLIAGPGVRKAMLVRQLAQQPTLPEVQAALRLVPLMEQHGEARVLIAVEDEIRRRELPRGGDHGDGR